MRLSNVSLWGGFFFVMVIFLFFQKRTKLAGLSSLGELSIEITDIRIDSGVRTGSQRSLADS